MTIRYTTRQDAIEQAIMPALTEGEYDYEAICYEAFDWKIDTNERGQELLNTGGFEQTVSDEEFWEIVARHDADRIKAVLAELEEITAKRQQLGDRRDEIVRDLMQTSVARKRLARAAGLKEARLYQIRDGRR
jgi:hypothetical protein